MAVDTLGRAIEVSGSQGQQFGPEDFTDPNDDGVGATLSAGEWVSIATVTGSKSAYYGVGAGPKNSQSNTGGWSDLDLKLTSDGGTSSSNANGRLRLAIYSDTERNDLVAKSKTMTANSLRAAEDATLREKILLYATHRHLAGDDSVFALEYRATSGEDGDEVDVADSTAELGVAYSEINPNRNNV